ncbi:MAG: ferritin-like domain-containing protein [Hyphomonadaceae bacterium]|nr:ferritin-like domain-containing protein [Hyphomonadaceae bacterium]
MKAGLDLPHPDDGSLARLVAGRVRRHGKVTSPPRPPNFAALFADEFFSLQRVPAFAGAGEETQAAIRAACAQGVLDEAYFIEKSGLAYCARMLLLAEDTQTRQAFALMGADEAAHLAWITAYVPEARRTDAAHPFLKLVAELIEQAPSPVLVYLLQLILEGWGLAHYRDLAAAAREPALAHVFKTILKDEGMHVRLGAALHDPRKFSDAERTLTRDALAQFLTLVRCGPLSVAGALAQATGAELVSLHEALAGEAEAARKLGLLRQLMRAEGMDWAGAEMQALGLFAPMTPAQAAALLR